MKIEAIVKRFLLIASSLALLQVEAGTIYVSNQGSDSNPGTSSQPFRTITHAYSGALPGTTIIVMPGVYTDYSSGWGIHLGASGTALNPIVLRSQTPGAAIIDGQNASDRNVGFYIDGSYNIVDGFEIRNAPKGGITIWANNNQILNCNIHNNGNPADSSAEGRDGVYSSEGTSGNVYTSNYIHHNGRTGSNLDHGLYLCGQNELVNNNVLFANAACGLQVAGYTTVSNMKVYNNVMALNGTDGLILWQALSGVDIRNNIFYKNGHWGIGSYDAHGKSVTVDHNLSFGNAYGDFSLADGGSDFTYNLGTTLRSDPLFVNGTSAAFDAHMATGSPGTQGGVNLYSVFTTDMAGAARQASGPWDLGVYSTSAPNTGSVAGAGIIIAISKVSTGVSLSWNSQSGKSYHVVSKNKMTDPWVDLSGSITAGGTSTSWTDTTANTVPQRFYRVYTTN